MNELLQEALDDVHAAVAKVETIARQLLGIGEADATALAAQAETAAKPVVQAAEVDGEQLAKTAEADVESILSAPAPTIPAPETTNTPAE